MTLDSHTDHSGAMYPNGADGGDSHYAKSALAHDLKEPMRSVSNYLKILEHRITDQLGGEAETAIGNALGAAERMQDRIDDLVGPTESSKEELVDSEQILAWTLADIHDSVERSKGEITHDKLPEIHFNASRLGQLFQNLISNALKFAGDRTPQVHISASASNVGWIFCVRDNGIGISTGDREQVFEMFVRKSGQRVPGTGIGLALCRKILNRCGGRIWVESEVGVGSSFYFEIPQGQPCEQPDKKGPTSESVPAQPAKSQRPSGPPPTSQAGDAGKQPQKQPAAKRAKPKVTRPRKRAAARAGHK